MKLNFVFWVTILFVVVGAIALLLQPFIDVH